MLMIHLFWSTGGADWDKYTERDIKMMIIIFVVASVVFGMLSTLIMHCYCDYKINICNSKLIILGIEDAKEDVDNDIYENLISKRWV